MPYSKAKFKGIGDKIFPCFKLASGYSSLTFLSEKVESSAQNLYYTLVRNLM
jgi:hypothetical protein